ncbi:2541_t:CDS:2 [Entrophospora sp. SA101]|nr:13979_t:CDS:2 [Entrophospora candida]CAH1758667.1 2541_t:CDS:2 [Entrophospora sp. SA101]
MYGNVGLTTPRGSGTNGYVVRNLSFVRTHKDPIHYESLEEGKNKPSSLIHRKPNQEILEHEKKRQIEIKCLSFRDELESKGEIDEDEIDKKVESHRQALLSSIDIVEDNKTLQEYQTHHLTQAKAAENEKIMKALGIDSGTYIEGAAFDKELQEQKKLERIKQKELEIEERKKIRDERQKRLEKSERERDDKRNHDYSTQLRRDKHEEREKL